MTTYPEVPEADDIAQHLIGALRGARPDE